MIRRSSGHTVSMRKKNSQQIDIGEMFDALEALEQTRRVPVSYMLSKIEAALTSAYHKEFDNHDNVRIVIDREARSIKVYQIKTIVETVTDPILEVSYAELHKKHPRTKYQIGTEYAVELNTQDFRRLSAGAGKSVIVQGIREGERAVARESYELLREEIINAAVVDVDAETGDAVLDTGNGQAVLHASEQIPGEILKPGQVVMVYIEEVNKESIGQVVTLSRNKSGFVRRMFELQIPEIVDGVVLIRGIAREAGNRTKIAVESRDPNVDAVGACIGNRGERINKILEEMAGEKIDIIRFSESPEEYVSSALAPAQVVSVTMVSDRMARAVVDPNQLSLAIGKEGQNARLAAKLTGLKIDIHSCAEGEF